MRLSNHPTPPTFVVGADGGAGLTAKQTRGRQFVTPTPGVRIRRETANDPDVRVHAALLACSQDVVLTDLTAARARNLPLPPWLTDGPPAASLAVVAGTSHTRRKGVRGRRLLLPPEHLEMVEGRVMTSAARTWLDCAAEIPLPHLVAMGDVVLRRELATPAQLWQMCRWGAGRRGVVNARRAWPLLDPAAESPGESLTRVLLLEGGVPRPRCNVDVFVRGVWLARVDLLWEEQKVIVEYDGVVHLPEEQRRKDALRRNLLQDAGYVVIVFTAADHRHPDRMCDLVHAALAR